jgi:exopolysaccharide biosynthesis protein
LATATPASHSAKRVDGRVIIALTRFDALDGAMDCVPFGLTTPEMPALMGAPGCRSAVALDGGISSQLRLRDTSGTLQEWRGLRKVPLALLAFPRGKPR